MNVADNDNQQFLLNIMRWLTNRVSIKDTKRLICAELSFFCASWSDAALHHRR